MMLSFMYLSFIISVFSSLMLTAVLQKLNDSPIRMKAFLLFAARVGYRELVCEYCPVTGKIVTLSGEVTLFRLLPFTKVVYRKAKRKSQKLSRS